MRECLLRMEVTRETAILDLGGTPRIWAQVERPLDITILNLPARHPAEVQSHHRICLVEGDACRIEALPRDRYDLVFSNSVIEHVGPRDRQEAFAREVRRLAPSYWVQTPSKWFPIEAHCGMPFWWFYPERLRRKLLDDWRAKLPDWTKMVEETRVLEKAELQALFPDAEIRVERFLGLPKSYIAMRRTPAGCGAATA